MWKHTDCVEGELEFFLLLIVHLGLFFAFLVLCVLNRMNFEILAVCIFFCANKDFLLWGSTLIHIYTY